LTDTDPGTYAICLGGPTDCSLTLGFTDNILVNGIGADLAVFELGSIEDAFQITLNGITKQYLTANVGAVPNGLDLNLALVNLDDFGYAPNAIISQFVLRSVETSPSSFPTFSLIGAVNTEASAVPEPSSLALMGAAGALLGLGKLRHQNQ